MTSPAPRRWLVVAALAVAFGLATRVVGLGEKPVWHDEVYTRAFVAGHAAGEWLAALYRGEPVTAGEIAAWQRLDDGGDALGTVLALARDEPQHPPLYYLLARLWEEAFGDGIGALRALSVLASLLAVAAAAWLGRELFGPRGPPAATPLVVALVGLSPFLALYAQEAREYALWSALVLATTAALLRALRRVDADAPAKERAQAWLLYAVLTALALYTCFSQVSVILAHLGFVGWRARGRLTRAAWEAALALGLAGLLFLPWAVLLGEHLEAFRASMSWSSDIVVPRAQVLGTLAVSVSRPLVDLWAEVGSAPSVVAVAAAVAVVGWALAGVARRGPTGARALLILLVALPIGLLLVPDLVVGGIRSFSTRYLMPALLACLVAVGWRVAVVAVPRRRALVAGALLAVVAASAVRTMAPPVPWTRGLSTGLPAVAAAVRAEPRPVVVGDRERHHPGNLMALATMVPPETPFVLLDHPVRDALVARLGAADAGAWPLVAGVAPDRAVFLYSPVPQLREAMEHAAGRAMTLVYEDLFVQCWRLSPP
ncbi:MAG: glycosyltransferase family 39 protein [Myxococcales bacterium]|nr:glycosyltransferase family 39 protein [Myxococcales bacterium]MCB9737118.1 glycosyltransferase family 39 protein [Deltaproteobacteria bacterium]